MNTKDEQLKRKDEQLLIKDETIQKQVATIYDSNQEIKSLKLKLLPEPIDKKPWWKFW